MCFFHSFLSPEIFLPWIIFFRKQNNLRTSLCLLRVLNWIPVLCWLHLPQNQSDHLWTVAIVVFPFSVDDKESNSSSGGDAKTKSSSGTASANSTLKNVNSNFNDSTTDKAINSNKSSTSIIATLNSDQTVTNCVKSVESASEQAKGSALAKANNCDSLSDVINNVIDTSGIKMEIKDDPDAPKTTKSVNNLQPALGGSLLPLHAVDSKHPVSTKLLELFSCINDFEGGSKVKRFGGEGQREFCRLNRMCSCVIKFSWSSTRAINVNNEDDDSDYLIDKQEKPQKYFYFN